MKYCDIYICNYIDTYEDQRNLWTLYGITVDYFDNYEIRLIQGGVRIRNVSKDSLYHSDVIQRIINTAAYYGIPCEQK